MTNTEARKQLPPAEPANPRCGVCGDETDHDGDGLYCEECGLDYDDTLAADYRDDEAEPCGQPCTNTWHGDQVWQIPYDCATCALPTDHISDHWAPCRPRLRKATP